MNSESTQIQREAVSRKEAAEMLGVSERTVIRLCDAGEIRQFPLLGQWRIRVAEIRAFMRRQEERESRKFAS